MRFEACAVLSMLLCASGAWASPGPREARPLLRRYCQGCHGPNQARGGLRFDRIDFDVGRGKDGERWQAVLEALRDREMPPPEKPQPRGPERELLIGWLQAGLDQAAGSKAGAASLLRRLTREQHSNTLRDLLGVASDYTPLLPPESPSPLGMHNDGRVLASSALHLEQTMKIARLALDRALSLGAPPPAWRFRFVFGPQTRQPGKPVDLGFQALPLAPDEFLVETFADRGPAKTPTLTPKGDVRDRCYVDLRGSTDPGKRRRGRFRVDGRGLLLMPAWPHVERGAQVWQGPDPHVGLVLRDFPPEGPFVLRLTVSRADPGGEAPWLRAFAGNRLDDGMEYTTFGRPTRVDAPPGKPQVIELRGRLENLPIPVVDPTDKEFLSNLMVIGVWNDVLVSGNEATSPALIIQSMEFEGPVTEAWPSASHRRVFFDDGLLARPAQYARQILERFLTRAFRRPASRSQIDRYLTYWRDQTARGARFEESVRDTLAAALSSPAFLHHVEEGRQDGTGPRRLDDHALASRLSYFLWNSMPDDELLTLAGRGQVRANLAGQAARLLADARARDFFETYAAQWLDLAALDRVRVDAERHPRYTRFVKQDMRLETSRFVEHLFQQNRPLGELVDAGYTLLNGNLAGFYGIVGVTGPEFRVVPIPPGGRGGGLLTQGSFLVGHSTGAEPHPIKRGVWLAKKLLDDPPPPPPPNVPEIDRENPAIARLPVRAQLELHRNRASCRGCHRKIDPWGIPLESFDAAGLPRADLAAADTRSQLPDGTEIEGVSALKAHLLGARRDQLRHSVARHLVAYALGRTPGLVDEKAVGEIAARARARGDGLRDLLMAVIESEAFASK
jgi:hypothetical protein